MAEKDKNPSPKLAAQIFADVGKHLETHMVKADNLDSEKIIERNWFEFDRFYCQVFAMSSTIKLQKNQILNRLTEKDSKSARIS